MTNENFLTQNNDAAIRAAWTAMDQTYGKTMQGYVLQPIDNSGQGRQQPWATPDGWTVTASIESPSMGGKFVIYKNSTTNDVMVVPMGTNGNSDAVGWYSNFKDFGLSQWRASEQIEGQTVSIKNLVYDALNQALADGGNLICAGDSKGGALTQFVCGDIIMDRDSQLLAIYPNLAGLTNDRIGIVARSNPGVEAAYKSENPDFNANGEAFDGVSVFYSAAKSQNGSGTEIVSQTGGGSINDKGLIYYFSQGVAGFEQFGNITDFYAYLHRLTYSGYDGLAAVDGDFNAILSQGPVAKEQMALNELIAIGSFFGSIGLGASVNTLEAKARMGASLLCGLVTSPLAAVQGVFNGQFGVETVVGTLTFMTLSNPVLRAVLTLACPVGVITENGAKYLGDGKHGVETSGEDLSFVVSSMISLGIPLEAPTGIQRLYGHTATGGSYVIDMSADGSSTLYATENGVLSKATVNSNDIQLSSFDAKSGRALTDGLVSCNFDTCTVVANVDGHRVSMQGSYQDGELGAGQFVLDKIIDIDGLPPLNGDLANDALKGMSLTLDSLAKASEAKTQDQSENNAFSSVQFGDLSQLVLAVNPLDPVGFNTTPSSDNKPWYQDAAKLDPITNEISSATSLVAALKSGKPLAIATSAFNFAATQSNAPDWINDSALGLNTVTSLINLNSALQRGDYFNATVSSVNSIKLGISIYHEYLKSQIIAQYGSMAAAETAKEAGDQAATTAINDYTTAGSTPGLSSFGQITQVISLFLELSTRHPNYTDAIMSAVALCGPWGRLVAAIYQADKVVHTIFDKAIGHEATAIVFGPLEEISGFINDLLGGLFGTDEYDIYGKAKFVSNGDGRNVHPYLKDEGDDGGGDPDLSAMQSLLVAINSVVEGSTSFGIMAARLPELNFYADEDGENPYFELVFKDQVTGDSYARRFDASGNFTAVGNADGGQISPKDAALGAATPELSAEDMIQLFFHTGSISNVRNIANSEDYGRVLQQQFIDQAIDSNAIVPIWEVRNADAQSTRQHQEMVYTTYVDADTGQTVSVPDHEITVGEYANDPDAGKTTLQRAAAHQQLLAVDPGKAKLNPKGATQVARPIVLDLDANGIKVTKRADAGGVMLDVDDDGYAEETDWINPRDGILVVDWNGDGVISGGHEMFSDSRVDMVQRGLHALDEVDSNGDGKITSDDIAYNELRVWQDINHDGAAQDYELSTLSSRNITSLYIDYGIFVMNGQWQSMAATPLEADSAGFITQPAGNSLLAIAEDGQPGQNMTLMARALADYSQAADPLVRVAHTHASDDGTLVAVDELADGGEDVPLVIGIEQLLANDASTNGTPVHFAGVDAASAINGRVTYDAEQQTVKFKPNKDFHGVGQFDYLVDNGSGEQVRVTSYIDVAPAYDAPVIFNVASHRAGTSADLLSVTSGPQPVFGFSDTTGLGDPVTDAAAITVLGAAAFEGQAGQVGTRNGLLYWSADQAASWRPVIVFDWNKGTIEGEDVDTPSSTLSYTVLSKSGTGQMSFDGSTGAWSLVVTNPSDSFVVEGRDQTGGVAQLSVLSNDNSLLFTDTSIAVGSTVKYLTLIGDDNLNATGNALDNWMVGNRGNNALTGGEGNDTMAGGVGLDTMTGGVGDDTYIIDRLDDVVTENADEGTDTIVSPLTYTLVPLENFENLTLVGDEEADATGNRKDNVLVGNDSANTLDGGFGVDTMSGGKGNDTYIVDNTHDVIHEMNDGGVDQVISSAHYTLSDNVENLQLVGNNNLTGSGNSLNNKIIGGNGNDWLSGLDGNDTLDGGLGDDVLEGGAGDDVYLFNLNSGDDIIEDIDGQNDSVIFGEGIDPDDVILRRINANGNLQLTFKNTDSSLTLAANWYGSGSLPIEHVHFANGQTWSADDLVQKSMVSTPLISYLFGSDGPDLLVGGSNDDKLNGGEGNDTLDGGAGNDQLDGGDGVDIYRFNLASGNDTITANSSYYEADVIELDSAIDPSKVHFAEAGLGYGGVDLIISFDGSSSTLTIKNYAPYLYNVYGRSSNQLVDKIVCGGQTWNYADVLSILRSNGTLDMAIDGGGDDDVIVGGVGNDTLSAKSGSDTLDGGAGNDELDGGDGRDTYLFGLNSGNDTVDAIWNYDASPDRVLVGSGIQMEDVRIKRVVGNGVDTNDVLVSLTNSSSSLLLSGIFSNPYYYYDGQPDLSVPMIEFVDGRTLSLGEIKNMARNPATAGNDMLSGYAGNDSISGGMGNDSLFGHLGDDTLNGGVGDDYLNGGEDNDTYQFGLGSGNDTIEPASGYGNDTSIDVLELGVGIQPRDVSVKRVGLSNDLLINLINSSDSVLIKGYFDYNSWSSFSSDVYRKIDSIKFSDGTAWQVKDVQPLALGATTSGNDTIVGYETADSLSGGGGDDLIIAGLGDDTIDGGRGNDVLCGDDQNRYKSGNNTFKFDRLSGNDTIEGSSESSTQYHNVVSFDSSISPGDITVRIVTTGGYASDHSSALVSIAGSTSTLLIDDEFTSERSHQDQRAIDEFNFTNNVTWSRDDIYAHAMLATSAADTLIGVSTADSLFGDAGDDYINGGNGDDTLNGGLGNDYLIGGIGSDVFEYDKYSGNDTIVAWDALGLSSETPDTDVLVLGANIRPEDVSLERTEASIGGDLLLKIFGGGSVLIKNYFDQYSNSNTPGYDPFVVEQIQFADGTIWGVSDVRAKTQTSGTDENDTIFGFDRSEVLAGEEGDDRIYGGYGDDTLDGGAGNDILDGAGGDDVYIFRRQSGHDEISDSGYSLDAQPLNIIKFASDIHPADVSYHRVMDGSSIGYDLRFEIAGSDSTLVVHNALLKGVGSIQEIQFADGAIWYMSDLSKAFNDAQPTAGDDILVGGAGSDSMDGLAGNDIMDGGIGNDTLVGGFGNDVLMGGYGNDTYRFQLGDGQDTIRERADYDYVSMLDASHDVLTLSGIDPNTVSVSRDDSKMDLLLAFQGSSDSIRIANYFGADFAGVTYEEWVQSIEAMQPGFSLAMLGVDHAYWEKSIASNATPVEEIRFDNGVVWDTFKIKSLLPTSGMVLAGTEGKDFIVGDSGDDTLNAGAGNDTLDGGGGIDLMTGGDGNDIYFVDNASDIIVEQGGNVAITGNDTVYASATYALPDNVETLVLTGNSNIDGSAGNNTENVVLTGNAGNNNLIGGSGDDFIDSNGGSDTLQGAMGDDVYALYGGGSSIIESEDGGYDQIWCYGDGVVMGDNVEQLRMMVDGTFSATGSAQANGMIGNNSANTLFGAGGNDTLNGRGGDDHLYGGDGDDVLNGGTGADWMAGGAGDDYYVVDQAGDVVVEYPDADGILSYDSVEASISYTVPANVEAITLTGTANINATSNDDGCDLTGNTGNNYLKGGDGLDFIYGDEGADTLEGGAGNDYYYLSDNEDTVIEQAGGGLDQIWAYGDGIIMADNVERLYMQSAAARTAYGNGGNNYLTGNNRNNTLYGNAGNDKLWGLTGDDTLYGGAGNDSLYGAGGNDTYHFQRDDGVDTIYDDDSTAGNQDVLDFDGAINANQVWLARSGDDLVVSVIGTSDSVTITSWFLGDVFQVESIVASGDGKTLSSAKVQGLVNAMASFTPPSAGQTSLPANYQATLNSVITSSWV